MHPLPPTQVMLKKEYQDQRRTRNPRLVGGRAWYNLQAFRAVNQAVGRQERDAERFKDINCHIAISAIAHLCARAREGCGTFFDIHIISPLVQ